jgi:fructose/tagatose bisphosphate aldolase
MPLVHLNDMLKHASHHHYAVGAFGVASLDFLDGVLQAAEACRSPVVLNLLESHFSYYDFDILMPAVLSAARKASVPVAVNFDHGSSKARAEAAIRAGCNGVMVDTSALPFSDNLWRMPAGSPWRASWVMCRARRGRVPSIIPASSPILLQPRRRASSSAPGWIA